MAIKNIRKLILAVAATLVVGFSAAASACTIETAHPGASITFEFNNKTYVVEYTLYRNMYPNTVKHFIELADNGFYDGMIIHDYSSADWITGGYEYNAESYSALSENNDVMSEYFENYSKENKYTELFKAGKFTSSVYSNIDFRGEGADEKRVINEKYALPTVMGEFSDNINQEIENGALTAGVGCLKMFYYAKETTQKVYVTPTADQIIGADYKSNCATSLFSVQVGSGSSYSSSKYCVFAKVNDTAKLQDFVDDVTRYFTDTYGSGSETLSASVRVDNYDSFSKESEDVGIDTKFSVPKTPVIVKSVKITKY